MQFLYSSLLMAITSMTSVSPTEREWFLCVCVCVCVCGQFDGLLLQTIVHNNGVEPIFFIAGLCTCQQTQSKRKCIFRQLN